MNGKNSLRMLIVEDDEDDFVLTRELLEKIHAFDFEVHRAATYAAAKKSVAEKRFDVCLVDYQLGERTGLEFMREAAAEGFRAPMILLSGQNDRASDLEAMSAGAADYLIKGKMESGLLERAIRYALERRKTGSLLEAAARRERTIVDNALNLICSVDAQGRFVSVNSAYLKVLGYQPEDLVGRPFAEFIAPEDLARTNEAALAAMSGEEFDNFENRCLHKNGAYLHMVWTSYWSESEQLMFAVAHDITERKQVEAALKESETRYRLLFENNPIPIWIWDVETLEFLAVNEEAVRLFGYSREEFQTLTTGDLCPPEDVPLFLEHIDQIAGVEKLDSVRLRKKDETIVEAEITLQTINFAGRIARMTLINDLSEHQRAQEAILRSEEKYRNILETIEEGYFETNLRGDFIFVNDALSSLLGYIGDELMGLNYKQYTDDANASKIFKVFAEVFESNRPVRLSKWEIIRRDGERRMHESSVSPMRNEKGKPIGFRGIVRDITDLQRSEKDLQESQQLVRLMIDALPQAIWWKDSQGVYKGANRFIAEAAGFESPERMVGLTDYDMPWTREEAEQYRAVDRRVMQTGVAELDFIETQLQHDGKIAVVTTNKVPMRNAAGEIVGVLGTFADITDQRRAVAALCESEYKLRTLLESMREGILQVDNDDVIVFVNECFCEMVGYNSDELMKTSWTRLIFDGDGRRLVEQVNVRRRDGISDSYEICLRKKSGKPLWTLVGGAPILDAEGTITGSMGVFTDITTRKRAEEQLLHDALHDGLTGLANRTLFIDHLQTTIERTRRNRKEIFAVLFLDFDRFKVVNDSLGHAEGDNLLKQIARRLESSLRAGDVVARLGGDEFTILINRVGEPAVVLRVAERIQANLQKPFEIGGSSKVFMSASIGIALSTTGHEKAEDMVRDADIAMYRAKAKGKAQHQVFDRAMHEQASKQLRLETEMRQALEREEFLLHYQPILNLDKERLVGFEALVRWKHPVRGMIPPFEFIPASEETGLILPLGKWILEESCRQLCQWQEKNPLAEPLTISVNLSSKQFLQPDLAQQVAAALEKTKLNPLRLKLEITESHIMENSDIAADTLNSLRDLGVELSLDDFGTGYSSLSYLHRLPVSYLKIDRSFVNRMIGSEENSEIVHTIIKLAQNLKKKVVAEGIETAEQLAQLKILNCEFGQGYFFAAPMGKQAAEDYLNEKLQIEARKI